MTAVLLLGPGGEDLAAAFRRLGATVHHVPADVAVDGVALRAAVEEHGVDHVVPLTAAVDTDALLALEAEGVGVVPSARGCALTTRRDILRRAANEESGLPTTASAVAGTREQLAEVTAELGFPCIVKPVDFSAEPGNIVLHSDADLDAAWNGGPVMVENFVDIDHELTLLAVRSIDPATGKAATWFCEPIGHVHEEGHLQSSWQPLVVSPQALDNARSMAARIATTLGGRGLFAVEMFVSGDDVYFSAVTPRPAEVGSVTLCTQRFPQHDLHARAVLGLPVDTTLISPGACARVTGEVDLAAALAVPESDVRLEATGGLALATAETVEEARERATQIAGSTIG